MDNLVVHTIPNEYEPDATKSTEWRDIATMSASGETSGRLVIVRYHFGLQLTPKRIAYIRLLIDGQPNPDGNCTLPSDGGIFSIEREVWLEDLPAGLHEFKLQWRLTGGYATLGTPARIGFSEYD